MIYQVTYKDENGNALQVGTFNAATPREALDILLTVSSIAPPAGTAEIDIVSIPSPPQTDAPEAPEDPP